MTLYTWDFQFFKNLTGVPSEVLSAPPADLPEWMKEVLSQEVHARGGKFTVTRQVLPAGQDWIDRVVAGLERRFPYEEGVAGWWSCKTATGLRTVYCRGADTLRDRWPKVFGTVTPLRGAPVFRTGYRPWQDQATAPFYDFKRSDGHETDVLGAPYFRYVLTQTRIDFAYAALSVADYQEGAAAILKELGPAEKAWRLEVRPSPGSGDIVRA
jgi:hypothetical protein